MAQLPVRADASGSWLANRYRLTRMLGRGGFGEVWHAEDTTLQRCVAIKLPRSDRVFTDERRRLFLAEARKAAGLHHPNIVPIHDIVAEASHWYLVSEYIDGTSLAEKIDKQRLSYQECTQLVATIAEALHVAHRHDLVHRDVKPGNILLDQAGKAYLTDFGLAASECVVEHPLVLGTWAP